MNFVGHVQLARMQLAAAGATPSPGGDGLQDLGPGVGGFLIGAALPDIAAMGRFRMTSRPADRSIRDGIELHHRTDDAFHNHRWFRVNSQLISTELERCGLSRGASRACGHVGVELLLDGRLLDHHPGLRHATQEAISTIGRPEYGLATVVEPERQPAWAAHIDLLSTWDLPRDYRHPSAVAGRLGRILSRRPRLAFPADQIGLVERVLSEHQAALEAEAEELMHDLGTMLAA